MAKAKPLEQTAKEGEEHAATLKRGGVSTPENQEQTGPRATPGMERDHSHARARVRDKGQEEGRETQGVRVTHTSWPEQAKAYREQKQAQTAEPTKENQTTKEQGREPETRQTKESEKPGWKEVKAAHKENGREGGKNKEQQHDRGQEQER